MLLETNFGEEPLRFKDYQNEKQYKSKKLCDAIKDAIKYGPPLESRSVAFDHVKLTPTNKGNSTTSN